MIYPYCDTCLYVSVWGEREGAGGRFLKVPRELEDWVPLAFFTLPGESVGEVVGGLGLQWDGQERGHRGQARPDKVSSQVPASLGPVPPSRSLPPGLPHLQCWSGCWSLLIGEYCCPKLGLSVHWCQ